MLRKSWLFLAIALCVSVGAFAQSHQPEQRWTEKAANDWYARQPWLVGSNYIPATAINELEMWQQETFDPERIDKELGWAESLGVNTMRVFLHDLPWQQDAQGFQKRIDTFLNIAAKHHIKPLFVSVRFLLGPQSQTRTATRASPGNSQFRLGAESWRKSIAGSGTAGAPASIRRRCGASFCKR